MKKLSLSIIGLYSLGALGAGFLIILGMGLATKIVGLPAWRQDINMNSRSDQNFFSAEGDALIEAVPDQAMINLGVEVTAPTVAQAQEQVNQIITNLQEELATLKIEKKDIKTENYSVSPDYDWENDRKIRGYIVTSNLKVTCKDFNVLNQVIDSATKIGANQVYGVNFSLSEDKKAQVKKEARQIAIEKAKKNAQELSDLAGVKLGDVINVYEYEVTDEMMGEGMGSAYNKQAFDSEAATTPTAIEPGSTSLNYRVSLTYLTR